MRVLIDEASVKFVELGHKFEKIQSDTMNVINATSGKFLETDVKLQTIADTSSQLFTDANAVTAELDKKLKEVTEHLTQHPSVTWHLKADENLADILRRLSRLEMAQGQGSGGADGQRKHAGLKPLPGE